jgi:hypothetical protein
MPEKHRHHRRCDVDPRRGLSAGVHRTDRAIRADVVNGTTLEPAGTSRYGKGTRGERLPRPPLQSWVPTTRRLTVPSHEIRVAATLTQPAWSPRSGVQP